jgi:TerC family integral membrane protein
MSLSYLVWTVTLVGLTGMLLADLLIIGRRPHEPSLREATAWVVFYVALAIAFGMWIWARYGATAGGEFYTGWLVEYSLSVDNLFVFMIIMSRFAVPRLYQQKVLLIGIILALVMRAVFIATGAVLITNFRWVFYVFGLFLLYTGIRLAFHRDDQDPANFKENALIRVSRRVLPLSKEFDGARLTTHEAGRRLFTPMLIVMIAIGTTDVVFAVDSIPAIFGITQEPYLVFTANVFALMGLRQLYFLIGGLVSRLVHLSAGLAVVLGFIGVKMIIEALTENNVPFINGGEPVWHVHFPIWISLPVIVVILGITTITSLMSTARQQRQDNSVDAHQ